MLDRVGDVMPSEGEVLESLGQAAVGSRVTNRGLHIGGDLGPSVNRRGAGFGVAHAGTLEDVSSILVLVEEEVVRPRLC
jgi:hypothetical protein